MSKLRDKISAAKAKIAAKKKKAKDKISAAKAKIAAKKKKAKKESK